MPIQDLNSPPSLPKSSAARAKDNAILNQIMSTTYTGEALHPERRRAVLDAARGARVELALSGQRHLTEERAVRLVAMAIHNGLEPLFGRRQSWMAQFEFNPFFEEDGGVAWSPSFYEPKGPGP